ncbi:hypothetical protein [Thioclava atlantica]|uniref:Uncharacterized protein n=1 Tax=Thioclava atlantica TaxID=1317124 RepID=A0A085TUT1_9RHOB|nr:hypothetical protein [Thioclava atlantica]KFE34478.1 hypothetical protein DW2_13035 [Thioclava atlantica]
MKTMTTMSGLFLTFALAAGAATAAQAASLRPPELMPNTQAQAPSGPNPAYYLPADPHLSLLDQSRIQPFAGNASLGNLSFEQVAAIENALLHPSLSDRRAALISRSLGTGGM